MRTFNGRQRTVKAKESTRSVHRTGNYAERAVLLLVLLATGALAQTVITEPKRRLISGGPFQRPFDVTRHTIPLDEIMDGGPPRDGIPALVDPKFISARDASQLLKKSDRVVGVFLNGQAKAYPVRILNYHELVNDIAGGRAALVSW